MADSVGNGNKTGFRPTLACQTNITPRQEKVHFQILKYPIKHAYVWILADWSY